PFDGTNPAERLTQQRSGPSVPLAVAAPTAPKDLVDAIERCLRFEPETRWPRVRELRDALIDGAAGGDSASLPALRRRLRGPRRPKRRAAFYGAGALGGLSVRGLGADLRFAWRTLRKAPGFSAAVVLTLAIGLAATTGMFTLLEGLVLRPPPVADPSSLVLLAESEDNNGHSMMMGATEFSYGRYRALARATPSIFSGLAAQTIQNFSLKNKDGAASVGGLVTSGNYFDVLGVRPEAGRFYGAREDSSGGGEAVAV